MILPLRKETIVLDMPAEEVIGRIQYATGKRRSGEGLERPVRFVGKVDELTFSITRWLQRPENFMPQIQGRVEPTSRGCILFLRFTLQFSSRMFVTFWTITTLMFALFLWFIQTRWELGTVALAVLLFNLAFTHLSFQRQYQRSRKEIMEVLGIAE